MSSRTWAAPPAAVEAYRNAPTPNVIVLEATANRDALVEQLDELSQYCDAGTKVIVLGRVNDIVLYRQLMARGRQRISGCAVRRRRVRPGDLATCSARPAPSRSAASSR